MKKQLFALAVLAVPATAFAALPAGVETAITGAGTDVTAAIVLMIGVAVAIWAIRKVLALFGPK